LDDAYPHTPHALYELSVLSTLYGGGHFFIPVCPLSKILLMWIYHAYSGSGWRVVVAGQQLIPETSYLTTLNSLVAFKSRQSWCRA